MDKGTALITGGMGFMGSHLTLKLGQMYKNVVVVDSFTYAARPTTNDTRWKLLYNTSIERCDIRDHWALSKVFDKYKPSIVYHLAAESHVCRSIEGPRDFITTNIVGTWHVAEECRKAGVRLVHVSTDEVFGEAKRGGFNEHTSYDPRSPYSASKASGDHIIRSYGTTYGLDYVIVHPSNAFGPNQHEEKLIPGTIRKILSHSAAHVYGDGSHMREWLWVGDFCDGITLLANKAESGNSYCLGGYYECSNLQMVKTIHKVIDSIWPGRFKLKIEYLNARPTDDERYSMVSIKAKALGFKPKPMLFHDRLKETVLWYFEKCYGTKEGGHG
jgi:dTDP-glucose 4,6-dehydratase